MQSYFYPSRTSDNSLNVTQLLFDQGADVNAVNLRREKVLYLSIMKGQKSLTQLLLARGVDVVLKEKYRYAPLTLASDIADEEIVQLLLEHDLQRQIQCGIFDDAKQITAITGHVSSLGMLFAKSPGQSPTDAEGRNLFHISAYRENLKCVQALETSSLDIKALDKQKRTCLHIAATAKRSGSRAVLEHLLK